MIRPWRGRSPAAVLSSQISQRYDGIIILFFFFFVYKNRTFNGIDERINKGIQEKGSRIKQPQAQLQKEIPIQKNKNRINRCSQQNGIIHSVGANQTLKKKPKSSIFSKYCQLSWFKIK